MIIYWLLFTVSALIVSLGQEDLLPIFSPLAAAVGLALFFIVNQKFDSLKKRFVFAFFWFFLVQAIKLIWVANPEHLGDWIILFYLFISGAIALELSLIYLLVKKEMSIYTILMVTALFTLGEVARIYVLMGFPWNPMGLALSSNIYSLQFASVFGVYGLSFLVYLTNLLFFTAYFKKKAKIEWIFAFILAFFPYIYGYADLYFQKTAPLTPSLNVLLVQSGITLKDKTQSHLSSPIDQWDRILTLIQPYKEKNIDLIILPEGAVSYPSHAAVFSLESVQVLIEKHFGKEGLEHLPPLQEPVARKIYKNNVFQSFWGVSHAYVAHTICSLFQSDMLVGLEALEKKSSGKMEAFQSLFLFQPKTFAFQRYDKQVLVPLGEVLPFEWCESLANYFGVTAFFTPGSRMQLLSSKTLIGPSICYEEIYGNRVVEAKQLGAKLLVNVTNDGWFPGNRLSKQHLAHARLRTVENGLPLLRACTTGITAAIDSKGKTINQIAPMDPPAPSALNVRLNLEERETLYQKWGHWLLVSICIIFILLGLVRFYTKK